MMMYVDINPADYLLYYKRATAYFSLSRHASALEDVSKVLDLTSKQGGFDGAHHIRAKIHSREGAWEEALKSLAALPKGYANVEELKEDVVEGKHAESQAKKEMAAQLWTACYESSTRALRVGAYSIAVREMRAECALRAGDIESAVGDMGRLTGLRAGAPSEHLTIFRLAYFFLPSPSSAQTASPALNALKQCLHLDPDSSLCLPAHRLLKKLDRGFVKVEEQTAGNDWRGLLDFLLGKDRTGTSDSAFLKQFEDALIKHTSPQTLTTPTPLPKTLSHRLTQLLSRACRAHTQLNLHRRGKPFCERLLKQDESTLDGEERDVGDAGIAENLLVNEEWEEAVRVLEGAWERGRSEDVSDLSSSF